MALQGDGKQCWVGCNANFNKYGKSTDCTAKDKGGTLANSVYKVKLPSSKNVLYKKYNGCYKFNQQNLAEDTNAANVTTDPDWATQEYLGCYINKDVTPLSADGIMATGMGKGYDVKSCKAAAVEKGFNTFAL